MESDLNLVFRNRLIITGAAIKGTSVGAISTVAWMVALAVAQHHDDRFLLGIETRCSMIQETSQNGGTRT